MAIHIGNNEIGAIYLGAQEIGQVYVGANLVWQKVQPAQFKITHTKQTGFSITLTCSTYNTVTINWGDGTSTLVNSGTAKTKTYSTSGNHEVTLTGDMSKITSLSCATQNVIDITLPPTATNIGNITLNGNSFPILDISMCVKLFTLYVYTNTVLHTISMPTTVTITGNPNYYINGCTALQSFTIPYGVTAAGSIRAYGCTALQSFNAPGVTQTTGEFSVYSNPNLTTFYAPVLAVCNANLTLYTNNSLTSIDLPELTTVNFLQAQLNPSLVYFNAPKLSTVNVGIQVHQCSNLTTLNCNAINPQQATTRVHFYGNAKLTSNLNFSNVTKGDIQIHSNILLTTLTLNSLTTATVVLIYGNTVMSNFSMTNIVTVTNGNLWLYSNTAQTSYNFPNLISVVGGAIRFDSNSNLASINTPNLISSISISVIQDTNLTSFVHGVITPAIVYNIGKTQLINQPISGFAALSQFWIQSCGLTQAQVDSYIAQCLVISNTGGGLLNLSNALGTPYNSAPSTAGIANAVTLRSRGWTVTHV